MTQRARYDLPFVRRVAFAVLVALCAVAAHQVTYLLGIAEGRDAVGAAVHDRVWLPLVGVVLAAAIALAVVGAHELHRLRRALHHAGRHAHPDREITAYLGTAARLWVRLAIVTLVLYGLQENVEHALVGLPLPGIAALDTHGWLPVIVVLVSSLLVAAVAGLLRWRCERLRARLSAPVPLPRRDGVRPARHPRSIRGAGRLGRAVHASRAPPIVSTTR